MIYLIYLCSFSLILTFIGLQIQMPHSIWSYINISLNSTLFAKKYIWLADNPVIYSARIISVIFELIVKGKWVQAAEFSQVLYVSNLRSNLLLYHILFMETINYKNSVILNRTTITSENALSVSTIPTHLFL